MARSELFNAISSEKVLQAKPNQNGQDFNLKGNTPLELPASLGTSQGNSNPDIQSSTKVRAAANAPSLPHGVLLRNTDAYTTRSPYSVAGVIKQGLVSTLNVQAARQQAFAGTSIFGKSVYGSPEVSVTAVTRDTISMPSNQNPNATHADAIAGEVIPSVGSRFYRG